MACYSGENPYQDQDERIAIWKWTKDNAIDKGLPFDQVHDKINEQFFNGAGRPEWINDILSGRKTPFREVADDLWRKQYNRQQVVRQATDMVARSHLHPAVRALQTIWNVPRSAAVFGHGLVFPVTHAGDLILRPGSWGQFFKGFRNTWTKTWPGQKAELARMMDNMHRDDLFNLALHSKLDVAGHLQSGESLSPKGSQGTRAWDALTLMRFEMWKQHVEKLIEPGMTGSQRLDIGKQIADWTNHATGSGQGFVTKLGGNVLFGPKLVQSKLNRMFVDPVKTLGTFLNWKEATPGEKAVAQLRLSGAVQYFGLLAGFLGANWGFNKATGKKDEENVNFFNPSKSDWLAFKGGGLEGSIPGMHSEIKYLGQMLASSYLGYLWSNPKYVAQQKALGIKKPWPPPDPIESIKKYAESKLNPAAGIMVEALTGKDFIGHPEPWSPDPGKPSWPRLDWPQYLLSKAPIPFSGPIRYFYDHLVKKQGASAADATMIIRGVLMFGFGLTGLHVTEDYGAAKEAAKRQQVGKALLAR